MAYVVIPTRTTADDNSSADINQLMANDVAVKAIAEGITPAINPNILINGGFDVWQRGISGALVDGTKLYLADRWLNFHRSGGGALPTLTATQELLSGTDLATGTYLQRLTTDGAGTTGTTQLGQLKHYIEDGVRKYCGLNKTVTLSFYATSSIANKRIGIDLNQAYGTGGSAGEVINGTNFTLTSTATRYTHTFTTNTLSGKTFGTDSNLTVEFWYNWADQYKARLGASTAETYVGAGTVDIWGVKLEEGSTATDFQVETYGDVLLQCQRYFYKLTGSGDATTGYFYVAGTVNYTGGQFLVSTPVKMRIQPTMTTRGFYITGTSSGYDIGTAMTGGNIVGLPTLQAAFSSYDLFCIYIDFGFSGGGYYAFDYITSTHDGRETEMSLSFDAEF